MYDEKQAYGVDAVEKVRKEPLGERLTSDESAFPVWEARKQTIPAV